MISLRDTLPTYVLPLSVVAFLQPLFETEGIVFPHQETETHGKRDFDFDLLPVFFIYFFIIFTVTFFNAGLIQQRQHGHVLFCRVKSKF